MVDRNHTERISLEVPPKTVERLQFLKRLLGEASRSTVAARAIDLFDRAVYPVLFEGARLVLQHKNETSEEIAP